jgi:hypothetical protein
LRLFKLKKNNTNRIDVDATLRLKKNDFKFELKSTTIDKVSTASPLHLEHINKWRECHWIIGIYNKSAKLQHCYYGTPDDMKEWLDYWEEDIQRDLDIAELLVERVDMTMVENIFGCHKTYKLEDVRKVFKNLYSVEGYNELLDTESGFKPKTMLKLFKEYNKFCLSRGVSRNNPKIYKSYYEKWLKIEDTYDLTLRRILKKNFSK